jgi:hypothetical protein
LVEQVEVVAAEAAALITLLDTFGMERAVEAEAVEALVV